MKKLLVSLTWASLLVVSTSSQATLLLYEPFDYPAGDPLGGSVTETATNVVGKIAPNGQQWIVRSPANDTVPYNPARDTVITNGSLSYDGLASSSGNAVRYGSATTTSSSTYKYTDAIAIPGAPYLSGSLYYSMIVKFHSAIPAAAASRTSYAAFSEDTANPEKDAGLSILTAGGGTLALPASAWIRYSGATDYHLGAGKSNSDGTGPSAGWPSWQAATGYPNQQGNVNGNGQAWATIENNTYFIVMKYTYNAGSSSDDTVSIWVNPVASTLGFDGGEGSAGLAGGSYYSATNSYVTAALDANFYGIQSFLLIGNAQVASRYDKTIDVSLDELRIGTTWADVTPVPSVPPEITSIAGAGTTSITVSWTNAVVGADYVLQYRTNLATGTWESLAPVTATGTTASQTDTPPSGDPVRYYRVMKP